MRCTYHVHNMFKHVYSTLIHTNFPCFKLRKGTVSLPVETELGHRSMWRWRYLQACWKNHAQATKMHSNVRKRWNKHMTAQAASWGKMGVNRDVEDLCIYSFWHVNAQCLVHFRSMKGADANLDLDVLPSLTARKAKKISPEFGCLPSEDEQWNGQKHSSPMVQRSDYPPGYSMI